MEYVILRIQNLITTIIIIVGIIILLDKQKGLKRFNGRPKYKNYTNYANLISGKYKKCFIMTLNEKNQFTKIKKTTDELGLWLFTKVRMLDIVEPIYKNQTLINKIINKHLDFVICNTTGNTICVIEIDDSSHNTPDRKESDRIKNEVLETAGIPLIRSYGINEEELKKQLIEIIYKRTI